MKHQNLRTFLLVLLTFFLILLALALFASPTQAVCLKRIRPKRQLYSREDVIALVQTAAGEYNRTETPEEKQQCAAVMWCVCWRQMAGSKAGFRDTIPEVCTQPWQFQGYSAQHTVTPELEAMAEDVLGRYHRYLAGETLEEVGAVIPPGYLWFLGNGRTNTFRNAYQGGATWTWTLPNPYEI